MEFTHTQEFFQPVDITTLDEGIASDLGIADSRFSWFQVTGNFQRFETGWNQSQVGDQAKGFSINVGRDGKSAQGVDLCGSLIQPNLRRDNQQPFLAANKIAAGIHNKLFTKKFGVV